MHTKPRLGGVFTFRSSEVPPQPGDTIHFYKKTSDFESADFTICNTATLKIRPLTVGIWPIPNPGKKPCRLSIWNSRGLRLIGRRSNNSKKPNKVRWRCLSPCFHVTSCFGRAVQGKAFQRCAAPKAGPASFDLGLGLPALHSGAEEPKRRSRVANQASACFRVWGVKSGQSSSQKNNSA